MFVISVQVCRVIRYAAALMFAMPALASNEDAPSNGSSQGHRSRSTYSLEIQPIGFGDGITSGVMGAYHLDPDVRVGLKYQHGEEASDIFDNYAARSDLVAINVKKFLGNSFYLEGGIGVRKKYVHRRNHDSLNDGSGLWFTHESNYSRTDTGFLIGLGNQWQWSHFTLGCEWIGAYIPVSPTAVKGNKEEILEDGRRRNLSMDHSDDESQTTGRFLNFYLGMVF